MVLKRGSAGAQSGFSMIEVTLVMVIGGILLSIFGSSLLNLMREAKIRQTEIRINEINEAMRRFAGYNNRIPCPANRLLRPEAASGSPTNAATNYGIEYTSCTAGALTGTDTSGGVRIGMVPTRTLGLPDEYGYDAWGSRFIYAATQTLTQTSTYDPATAAISVVGAGSANAAYVIVSVGPDREGGYSVDGTLMSACNATAGLDSENCDINATFRNGMHSMARNANYYDDYIRYQSLIAGDEFEIPAGAVIAFRLNSCPSGWDELTQAAGRVIVGRGAYVQPTNPPSSTVPAAFTSRVYNPSVGEVYGSVQTGGWVTRQANPAGPYGEYDNMPPYIVYRYCVKN